MVTKTPEEIDEMRLAIRKGELPADAIEKYLEDEEKNVFGFDMKHDRTGNPVEQGIGSPQQPSRNSIDAYKVFQTQHRKGGPEPDYDKHLARMEAELAEYLKKQAARSKTKRKAA